MGEGNVHIDIIILFTYIPYIGLEGRNNREHNTTKISLKCKVVSISGYPPDCS